MPDHAPPVEGLLETSLYARRLLLLTGLPAH